MTNNDEVIAVACDLAADAIVEHGHAKGALVDNCGRMCVYGALDSVASMRVANAAADAVEAHLGGHDILLWNNAPERTAAEVVAAFRDTAAALRAQSPVETPATTVAVYDPRWVIGAPEGAVRTVVEVVS